MAYLGNDLQVAYQSYQIIDDISGSFNGVLTSFALQVGGVAPVPFPINPQQCLISVNGVIQEPDPSGTSGFNLVGSNIVFASAPTGGHTFFGVILAGADYVNVGVNYPSGSESAPSITFDADLDTGLFNPAANEIAITTNSTKRLNIDSSGQVEISAAGSAASPALVFNTDINTGIYSPSADQLAISTNGAQALYINSDGDILVADGNRMEIDEIRARDGAGLKLFDDAGAGIFIQDGGNVGLGTSSPSKVLQTASQPDTTNPSNGASFEIESPGLTAAQINATTSGLGMAGIAANFAGDHHIRSFWGVSIDKGAGGLSTGASNSVNSDSRTFSIRQFAGGTTWNTQFCVNASGNVGIGTTSPGANLHVAAPNNSQLFLEATDTNPTTIILETDAGTSERARISNKDGEITFDISNTFEALRIDSSGKLLVGTSSNRTVSGINAITQVETTNYVGFSVVNNTNDVGGGGITIGKSRGTSVGGVASLNNNDEVGNLYFAAADGTDLNSIAGSIRCFADGSTSANDTPGRLVFSTTAGGSASPTERMRITSDAYVRLASGTGGIQFNGDTAAANALDDYEEGTWTGSWYSGADGTGSLLGTSTGNYVKVGRLVHVNITRGGVGTGTTLSVAGLPYPTINDALGGQTSDEKSIYIVSNSVISFRAADGVFSRFELSYMTN